PAIILFLAFSGCAHAAGTRILIVDPSHSDTGEACAQILSIIPDAELKKVDIPQLAGVSEQHSDAIVWITPEPLLYKEANKKAFETLIASKAGLLVIGLAHDAPGRKALFKSLSQRGASSPGVHLEKHLEKSMWIWAAKTKDESHVYLRK